MTDKQQRDNPDSRQAADGQDATVPPAHPSRRKFATAGLAASSVLLTLASRPVIGQVVSKSPSGFLSGNQSSHGTPAISQGRSPGYWKNHPASWPVPTSTRFSHVFNCSPSSPYAKYTLLELLWPKKDDPYHFGMHLVAAYLNAMKGWTPFLEEQRIKAMFTEWQAKGVFSPTATVSWTAPEIVTYLKATQW